MVQPRRTRLVDRLQTRQRGPGDAKLLGMDRSAPLREPTQVDLQRGILRQNAALFVHDDSLELQAFKTGSQIDLRLGCHPEYV